MRSLGYRKNKVGALRALVSGDQGLHVGEVECDTDLLCSSYSGCFCTRYSTWQRCQREPTPPMTNIYQRRLRSKALRSETRMGLTSVEIGSIYMVYHVKQKLLAAFIPF